MRAGIVWGLVAGLGYASMNLCLRATAVQVDPVLGALVRSVPVSLLGLTMLAWQWRSGPRRRPSARALGLLALVGLLFNVSGNGSFQLALALTGLTVTVPVSSGAVLWGGTLVGWRLMGEVITRRAALGLGLLVVALPLLISGSGGLVDGRLVWLGGLAAAVAGLSYGGGNALMRRTVVSHGLSQGETLAVVPTVGLLALLVIAIVQPGLPALMSLAPSTIGWLLVAGGFNAIALGSLSRALTSLSVARANALSTLQTAISAAGGVLIFAEPLTGRLLLGLGLTIVGVVLAQAGRRPTSPAGGLTTAPPSR